ncbi:MAG: hypothetical protein CMD81_03720 [Gammaproteobacteria bacterium]|nr:hypothetical protein [Gammaproteobacteria bacterium]HBF08568.1 hypothetical protein [Gammaproteobacteria bacterium]|tara:strand:- start:20899 stop:21882 length:984 start_codon:yes stop_codon:yes gene_type:complete
MENKKSSSSFFLIIDCIMLLLIIANLSWIFFDALFESQSFRGIINWASPAFHDFYLPIHSDFLKYDLIFVSIYIFELVCRWIKSILDREFSKWYVFPFAHWYDVLGCIPIGAFHSLRILRVVVILKRMQELGFIDWKNTFLIKTYQKYMAIITEEVSDRVVTQVSDGMASELQQGTPVLHQITEKALSPRTHEISEWLSSSVTQVIHDTYDIRRTEFHDHIREMVTIAAAKSQDLSRIKQIPLLGDHIGEQLERTITTMVFDITDQVIDYLRSDLSTHIINEGISTVIKHLEDPKSDANHLVQEILLDTIEVLKQQVQIQQWKTTYG